jgi:hypothetical protein
LAMPGGGVGLCTYPFDRDCWVLSNVFQSTAALTNGVRHLPAGVNSMAVSPPIPATPSPSPSSQAANGALAISSKAPITRLSITSKSPARQSLPASPDASAMMMVDPHPETRVALLALRPLLPLPLLFHLLRPSSRLLHLLNLLPLQSSHPPQPQSSHRQPLQLSRLLRPALPLTPLCRTRQCKLRLRYQLRQKSRVRSNTPTSRTSGIPSVLGKGKDMGRVVRAYY